MSPEFRVASGCRLFPPIAPAGHVITLSGENTFRALSQLPPEEGDFLPCDGRKEGRFWGIHEIVVVVRLSMADGHQTVSSGFLESQNAYQDRYPTADSKGNGDPWTA